MKLYEYLNENVCSSIIDWEKYQANEKLFVIDGHLTFSENNHYLEDIDVINASWEGINQWCIDNAENCCEDDAVLITRLLNDTIKSIISSNLIPVKCSHYARCYVFANHNFLGNELMEKCKLTVNNSIANIIFNPHDYKVITISDISNCDPYNDIWEDM